jgi:hypothetical protein
VLGTFSAGKSTFVNYFLGHKLQRTGNQAVDDRFTVIVYSPEETGRTLPGVSLDSDPRFPFYRVSQDIEHVAAGEGKRIDAYLQLKTCKSERLRGKILIDSPGFDADAQRDATAHHRSHDRPLGPGAGVLRRPPPGAGGHARHPQAPGHRHHQPPGFRQVPLHTQPARHRRPGGQPGGRGGRLAAGAGARSA